MSSVIRSVRQATRTVSNAAARSYSSYEGGSPYYQSERSDEYRGSRYENNNTDRYESRDRYQNNRSDRYDNNRSRRPYDSQNGRPRYNNNARSPYRMTGDRLVQRIKSGEKPPHLMSLADLSPAEIQSLVVRALAYKQLAKNVSTEDISRSLSRKTVAMLFSKRSTRTRVAGETAMTMLGGHPMFLGSQDIQLGVNETLADSAKVISSMANGIFARVGGHEEIEELAKYSSVPVINALSDLYHPTQILADLLTLVEHYNPDLALPAIATAPQERGERRPKNVLSATVRHFGETADLTTSLSGKKVAWVGDTNNITNELLVTLPRFGMKLAIASPKGYDKVDPRVWARVEEAGTQGLVQLTNSPSEALKDANVVVTDTWISMGQEEEKAARLKAFEGYQITNAMVKDAGASNDWIFMHCLPRKQEEVDDEVFYGDRSVVFPEAENRKWTIAACFHSYYSQWKIALPRVQEPEETESVEETETY